MPSLFFFDDNALYVTGRGEFIWMGHVEPVYVTELGGIHLDGSVEPVYVTGRGGIHLYGSRRTRLRD